MVISRKKILINDSCVLFDLVDLNLLEEFFHLEYIFYTTLQVIREITDDIQMLKIEKHISNSTLKIDISGSLESIESLFDQYPSLSYTDCSVLELATRVKGILISSDKSLRNISKRNNLDVKGVLWVINELLVKSIISKGNAINRLKEYSQVNVRAPIKEIKKMIEILEESQQ